MGVPNRLLRFCGAAADGELFVEVRHDSEVAPEDLTFLAGLGIDSLRLWPRESFDLRSLGHAIGVFRVMSLATSGAFSPEDRVDSGYIGLEAFASAIALNELQVGVELAEDVDLSRLPNLRIANTAGTFALSAALNPNLRELYIDVDRLPVELRITAPLRKLVVHAGRTLAALPPMEDVSQLTDLAIGDAARFHVNSLAGISALRFVAFDGCRELDHVDARLGLPQLDEVEFVGTLAIPGVDVLAGLKVSRFEVDGNRVFDEAFQAKVKDRPGWTFTPFRPSRGAQKSSGAATTNPPEHPYAPFELSQTDEGDWEISYDDWTGLAELLDRKLGDISLSTVDDLVEHILEDNGLLETVEVRSDDSGLRLASPDRAVVENVVTLLAETWSDSATMRALAKKRGACRVAARPRTMVPCDPIPRVARKVSMSDDSRTISVWGA
jgi:hypothetical protein